MLEQKQFNGERTLCLTNGAGTTGHPHANKVMTLDRNLITFTKRNSKWITDINANYKTIKFLKNAIREDLGDLGFVNDLLDLTSKA